MAVLAIDLDNTIIDNTKENRAFPGVREAINILREQGHKIMIHSCNRKTYIAEVLDNLDIRYDHIWNRPGKPMCDLYIDDRGYGFRGDWKVAVEEISEHKHVKDKDNRKW